MPPSPSRSGTDAALCPAPFPLAMAASRRITPVALLLFGMAALGLAGCGDGAPPPPEFPGLEGPRGPTQLTVSLQLTFTRDEAPVTVPRTVVLSLPDPETPGEEDPSLTAREALGDHALLLDVALTSLLAGPTEAEREEGVTSFFSEATSHLLREVYLEDDRAVVDFHDLRSVIPNASTSAGSLALLSELNGTVFALPGIRRVEYRMEGSCEAFWNFLQHDCQVVDRPAST